MLENATVLLVRHGEKPGAPDKDDPKDGRDLSQAGRERAQAYVAFFQDYTATDVDGAGPTPVKLDGLFATADTKHSHRPKQTLQPLAASTGLTLNTDYADDDLKGIVGALAATKSTSMLVCWHHGKLLDLATALLAVAGGDPFPLAPASTWPAKWPGTVFGWIVQIRYDSSGAPDVQWVKCANEQLMFDDTVDPPGPPDPPQAG